MRVAIVMPLAEQRGGAELMLMHLLRANRHGPGADYRVAFLEDGPLADEVRALGYPVQVFPAGQLRDLPRFLAVTRRLRQWFKRERVQLVLSWMSKAHLYAGPAAALAGVPAVWWQHGIPGGHWMDRTAARLPAREVFCSSNAVQAAQRRVRPARDTSVIYPAVDLERFHPARLPTPGQARRQLGLPPAGPLVGIVCRLQHGKGVHVFLDAAAQVLATRPGASFVVVGGEHALEPDYPARLASQVRRLGLADRVLFAGYQACTELWMQALDVCVHASTGTEAFGMVIIEAMALGKVTLAAKADGPLEIIEDGVDGLLVEPGKPALLAEAIRCGLERQATDPAMPLAARRKAAQFGKERLAAEVALRLEVLL